MIRQLVLAAAVSLIATAALAQAPKIVTEEMMLAAIAFDVRLVVGITLHLPQRLIRHAVAMRVIKLHQTTSAHTADHGGVLSSVDLRC